MRHPDWGAACGEIISYTVAEKILGENPALENSSLYRWVKHRVDTQPNIIGLLVFTWAVLPIPDDTVIIPIAMARYSLKRMLLPLITGKLIHNMGVASIFYYFTTWSSDRVSTHVQTDLALGSLIAFVMLILYQVEKNRAIVPTLNPSESQ